ncbi:MAG: DNA recombination protein RmuC, partial [Gemmatimonadaceae bacterium]|nr:DNA recombination protein RmuC [Gemmatimonadaceae bacterium]
MSLQPLLAAGVLLLLGVLAGLLAGQRRLIERAATIADLRARLEAERSAAAGKLAALQGAEQRLAESFQHLSNVALRQNNEAFLQLAQTQFSQLQQVNAVDLDARQKAIGELVTPLRETLDKVDVKLQQVEKERVGAYEMLMEQVRAMGEGQRDLAERTRALTTSLRSPNVRGRWGEIQLKRVCEMAGMIDHCDFIEQASVDSEAGKLRPDVTVRLPGGKLTGCASWVRRLPRSWTTLAWWRPPCGRWRCRRRHPAGYPPRCRRPEMARPRTPWRNRCVAVRGFPLN